MFKYLDDEIKKCNENIINNTQNKDLLKDIDQAIYKLIKSCKYESDYETFIVDIFNAIKGIFFLFFLLFIFLSLFIYLIYHF